MKHLLRPLLCFVFVLSALFPSFVLAQGYNMIAPLPGLDTGVTLESYLTGIFRILIGIAGLLAVLMLVLCGLRMIGSPSVAAKQVARDCILRSVIGLLIALGSYLLLNTISTNLISTAVTMDPQPAVVTTGTPPPTLSGTTYAWAPGPGCPTIPGTMGSVVMPSSCTPPPSGSVCCAYVSTPLTPTPPAPPPAPLPIPPFAVPPTTPPPPPYVPPVSSVYFSPASYTVAENAGFVTLTITRTPVAGVGGTINFTVTPGAAQAVLDYNLTAGTVTFGATDVSQTIVIPIVDNTLGENDESFSVTLSGGTGDIAPAGGALTSTITIIDDELSGALDALPPVVSVTNPVDFKTVLASPVTVDFTATDETNLLKVDVAVTGPNPSSATSTTIICPGALCPTLMLAQSITIPIDTSDAGIHIVNVRACDTNNCTIATTKLEVPKPCVNIPGILTCATLPTGIAASSTHQCYPDNGLVGSAGTDVVAYRFVITDPFAGDRWLGFIAGVQNEFNHYLPEYWWPPAPPVTPPYFNFTNLGYCPLAPTTCYEGTAPPDPTACMPPSNLLVSISDIPGDMSSTASTPFTEWKRLSGNCGNGTTFGNGVLRYYLSAVAPGAGKCYVEPGRPYYVNVQTIPFKPYGSGNYTMFWNWVP